MMLSYTTTFRRHWCNTRLTDPPPPPPLLPRSLAYAANATFAALLGLPDAGYGLPGETFARGILPSVEALVPSAAALAAAGGGGGADGLAAAAAEDVLKLFFPAGTLDRGTCALMSSFAS